MFSVTIIRRFSLGIVLATATSSTSWADNPDAMAGGGGFPPQQPPPRQEITREIQQLRQPHKTDTVDETVQRNDHKPPTTTVLRGTPVDQQAMKKLARKSDFDFEEVPLESLAEVLADDLKINVLIDRRALADESISSADEITFRAKDVSYRFALKHCLGQYDLTHSIEGNVLKITTLGKAMGTLVTRVYPVQDLVRHDASTGEDYDSLTNVISWTIAPETWDEVGGPATMAEFKGQIVVSQTPDVHARIEGLLRALRQFPPATSRIDLPDELEIVGINDTAEKTAIAEAMRRRCDIDLEDVPLSDAVAALLENTEAQFVFDERSLDDSGIDRNDEVSLRLAAVPVAQALDLLLEDLELAWHIDGEAIVITSELIAEETLTTSVYDVAGLVDDPNQPASNDADSLIQNLVSVTAPSSWEDVGGPGSVEFLPQRNVLVVSNTDPVHREVESQLKMLLAGRKSSTVPQHTSPATVEVQLVKLSPEFSSKSERASLVSSLEEMLAGSDNAINGPEADFYVKTIGGRLVVSHRRDALQSIMSILEKLNAVDGAWDFAGGIGGGGMMGGGGMIGGGMGRGGGMF